MASISMLMNRPPRKGAPLQEQESPLNDEEELPSLSRVLYDENAEYSYLIEAALQRLEVAEKSGFTNSEALIQVCTRIW